MRQRECARIQNFTITIGKLDPACVGNIDDVKKRFVARSVKFRRWDHNLFAVRTNNAPVVRRYQIANKVNQEGAVARECYLPIIRLQGDEHAASVDRKIERIVGHAQRALFMVLPARFLMDDTKADIQSRDGNLLCIGMQEITVTTLKAG